MLVRFSRAGSFLERLPLMNFVLCPVVQSALQSDEHPCVADVGVNEKGVSRCYPGREYLEARARRVWDRWPVKDAKLFPRNTIIFGLDQERDTTGKAVEAESPLRRELGLHDLEPAVRRSSGPLVDAGRRLLRGGGCGKARDHEPQTNHAWKLASRLPVQRDPRDRLSVLGSVRTTVGACIIDRPQPQWLKVNSYQPVVIFTGQFTQQERRAQLPSLQIDLGKPKQNDLAGLFHENIAFKSETV
ncbi:hypothetical protein HY522_03680 [bacterium]|nr:hypothetical protein [bacterium]